jgi:ABC-type nitrate/sulfonate/bicarbonate transport system substrate-binding protein
MNLFNRMGPALLVGLCVALPLSAADDSFTKKVGDIKAAPVKAGAVYELPFLTWGADVATFIANGGKGETKPGTLFAKQGLKFNLVSGDDFVGQLKNYVGGKTPFLRGTLSQLGQASEVIGKDPTTAPVVFLQLSWSAGDHMVARPSLRTVNQLKGKKICLQYGGPHVGMLDDVLRTDGLKWSDITVVWVDDITGKNGPAEKFRKDPSIDACFCITPDMEGLTGGLTQEGTGAETTVKGARVVVSTKSLGKSIADVYACRKDYYDKNKETVDKLAAAYLKACEELLVMRNNHDAKDKKDKDLDKRYTDVLKMTQDIYGKETIPDLDAAHGLITDATLAGLPGNYSFFKDDTDQTNFKNRAKAAVDMAVNREDVSKRYDLTAADLDYDTIKKAGELAAAVAKKSTPTIIKPEDIDVNIDSDKNTIYSFTVQFEVDDPKFDVSKYEKDFQKAIELTSLYSGALVVVRGHVDPLRTLGQFVSAARKQGLLTVTEVDGKKKYFTKDGKPFDLTNTKKVIELIESADFTGLDDSDNPKQTLKAVKDLAEARAGNVRQALITLAKDKSVLLAAGRLKVEGVGIREPVIPVPKTKEDAALNRRVEFRIIKVSPEKLSKNDFDL